MIHDVSESFPTRAHLELWEESLENVSHLTSTTASRESHTRTDKKAMAAPSIEAMEAIRNPGQMPYVKPMRDIEPAKPNRGGCDASTREDVLAIA